MTAGDRPLGAPGAVAVALGLAATAIGLQLLRAHGLLTTGFFGWDSGVRGLAFQAQLAALVAGPILLQLVPVARAPWILIGEGALCLAAYGPVAPVWAAGLLIFPLLVALPLPRPLRPLVIVGALVALGLWGAHTGSPAAYGFAMLFVVRFLVYAWEAWQTNWPRPRPRDWLLYILSPPLIVFPPYVGIIPFFSRHAARLAPRWTVARARSIALHLVLAGVWTASLPALGWLRLRAGALDVDAIDRILVFLLVVARVARLCHLAHGLLLAHGLVDRVPIDRPLLARNYVDFWKRYQIHQKDVQVAFFFSPVLLALRKRNRYLALIAASAVTMLIGNLALHWLTRYVYEGSGWLQRLDGLIEFYLVSFVVLAATLCLAEWRTRHKRPPPTGFLYGLLTWLANFLFVSWLLNS